MSFREDLDALCARLPGAELADTSSGEHDAWKVGGKMFACFGKMDPGVSVKTRDIETATMLIDSGIGRRAPYFHRSWIRLDPDCGMEEARHRIATSYDLVRAGLTRKVQNSLPPRGDL